MSAEEERKLAGYATGARYAGWDGIPLGEARKAVVLARKVRRAVRRQLPRAVLRTRGAVDRQWGKGKV